MIALASPDPLYLLILPYTPYTPLYSAFEGGTANFNLGNVSVRLVNPVESRRQGQFIKKFYSKAPVSNGDTFLVIPFGGTSGFFDKKGLWNAF